VAVDGDVADLVDNQQFCLAVELEPFLDAVLGIGPGQGGNERHGLGEAGPVTFGDNPGCYMQRWYSLTDLPRNRSVYAHSHKNPAAAPRCPAIGQRAYLPRPSRFSAPA